MNNHQLYYQKYNHYYNFPAQNDIHPGLISNVSKNKSLPKYPIRYVEDKESILSKSTISPDILPVIQSNLKNSINLLVILKKENDSIDNSKNDKKISLIIPLNIRVSDLKAHIEQCIASIFPKNHIYTIKKIESQSGNILLDIYYVNEVLHNNDKVYAYFEILFQNENNVDSDDDLEKLVFDFTRPKGSDLNKAQNANNIVDELVFLVNNPLKDVIKKLRNKNYKHFKRNKEVLGMIIPFGFLAEEEIMHNVSTILNKILNIENLYIFERRQGSSLLNMIISLLDYWITEIIIKDNFLFNNTLILLWTLIDSELFCKNFKDHSAFKNLIKMTNDNDLPKQIRAKLNEIMKCLLKKPDVDDLTRIKTELFDESNHNMKFIQKKIIPKKNESDILDTISHIKTINLSDNDIDDINEIKNNKSFIMELNRMNNITRERQIRSSSKELKERIIKQDKFNSSYIKTNWNDTYDKLIYQDSDGVQHQKSVNAIQTPIKNKQFLEYKECLELLGNTTNKESQYYGLTNLAELIDNYIDHIMANKDDFLKCINIIDIELPYNIHKKQIHILDTLNKNLIETRALNALEINIISKILKSLLKNQLLEYELILQELLKNIIIKSKYNITISNIISLIQSPFNKLNDFGMMALSIISDPNEIDKNNRDKQFAYYVKTILDFTLIQNKTHKFINLALKTIVNLSYKENFKILIMSNKGLDILIYHLKNQENLEGQRLSAKGLMNLSINSDPIRLKIIIQIPDEIKKMHKYELDSLVHEYIQNILNGVK